MLFVTTYRLKPFMSKDETRELMEILAANPPEEEEIAHYVATDGSYGIVVDELDDVTVGYQCTFRYAPFIQFETKAMLTLDQAVPLILEALA